MVYQREGSPSLRSSPLSHLLAHRRSISTVSDSSGAFLPPEPVALPPVARAPFEERERPLRLEEDERGRGERRRPVEPPEDPDVDALELDESEPESEPEPEPLLPLRPSPESEEVEERRDGREELRDRLRPERSSLRSAPPEPLPRLDLGPRDRPRRAGPPSSSESTSASDASARVEGERPPDLLS